MHCRHFILSCIVAILLSCIIAMLFFSVFLFRQSCVYQDALCSATTITQNLIGLRADNQYELLALVTAEANQKAANPSAIESSNRALSGFHDTVIFFHTVQKFPIYYCSTLIYYNFLLKIFLLEFYVLAFLFKSISKSTKL